MDAVDPDRGHDRLGRHVDDVHDAPHPNCMLEWMEYTLRPTCRPRWPTVLRRGGQQHAACDPARALDKELGKDAAVDTVRYGYCGDEEFLDSIYLWKTPLADCGDDRGATCTDYSVWQQKWTEVRGA